MSCVADCISGEGSLAGVFIPCPDPRCTQYRAVTFTECVPVKSPAGDVLTWAVRELIFSRVSRGGKSHWELKSINGKEF